MICRFSNSLLGAKERAKVDAASSRAAPQREPRGGEEAQVGGQRARAAPYAQLKQRLRPSAHCFARPRKRKAALQIRDPADGPELHRRPRPAPPLTPFLSRGADHSICVFVPADVQTK